MIKDALEVDIQRIHPNLRMMCGYEEIEGICDSIRCHGLLEPLCVWFDGERFRILDGEKRWRACKRLGISRVRVVVVETLGSVDA